MIIHEYDHCYCSQMMIEQNLNVLHLVYMPVESTRIGGECEGALRWCPYGSHCDDVTNTCVCNDRFMENDDGLFCRLVLATVLLLMFE